MINGTRAGVILSLCLVLAVTALAYVPSLGNGFTNWDDDRYVTANQTVRELTWSGVGKLFTSFQLGNYHPLTLLSYALQYPFFGLDARGYHAVNLALHLLNTALIFWIVRLLGGAIAASLAAALLFGVHPTHVESVAWIAEHKDVLSGCFFLGALVAYLRYRPGGKGKTFPWLSCGLLLLSLLAKAMAVTFPLVMILCDYLRGRKPDRQYWMEKIPFFGLAGAFGVLALLAQVSSRGIRVGGRFPPGDSFFIACHGVVFYLAKTVLPVRLSALYPLPVQPGATLPLEFLLSPLAAGMILAGTWYAARRSRAAGFGLSFFLVMLLPVLQFVPLGYAHAADRYLYLPSLGLCYLAGYAFSRLLARGGSALTAWKATLWAGFAGLVIILSALTWQRNLVWRDSLTLWNDVIAKYPQTAFNAYVNRGAVYLERGEFEPAIRDFTRAGEINPLSSQAYFNRGVTYLRMGEKGKDAHLLDGGIADLNRALALYPAQAAAYQLRGYSWAEKGELDRAMTDYTRALDLDPSNAESAFQRGLLFSLRGEHPKAIEDFTRAIGADPKRAEAYYNRGNSLMHTGDLAGAVDDYGKAVGLKPDYAEAYNNRGAAHAARGENDPALADFTRAVGINPDYRGAYFNRGRLLENLGRREQAAADFARAGDLASGTTGGLP